MKGIIRQGDRHLCPLHGEGTVTTGASHTFSNGKPIARVGDQTSCGAVIVTGASSLNIEGKPAARHGDTTDHGGTLIAGDAGWVTE